VTSTGPVQLAAGLVDTSPAVAMRLLAPYLASEPDDPYALCLAAHALIDLDQLERSLEMSRRAARLAPDEDWPIRLQASALVDLGRTDEARHLARLSVRTSPGNWQGHYLVAATDLAAKAVRADSMAAAEQARRLAPDEPAAHVVVGQVALARRRPRLATQSFEQALRLDPDDTAARHELARAQLRRFRLAAAVSGFLAVGRMDPTNRTARTNLTLIVARAALVLHYTSLIACRLSPSSAQGSAALVLVVLSGAVVWLRSRGGPALYRFLASIPRSDVLLTTWIGLLLLADALLILGGLLTLGRPFGTAASGELSGPASAMIILGLLLSWIRWRRIRSAGRSG